LLAIIGDPNQRTTRRKVITYKYDTELGLSGSEKEEEEEEEEVQSGMI
jgi:hypothetical protein